MGPFRIVPKILFLAQKNQEKNRENKKKELEAERGRENVASARCNFIRYENYICSTELRE